MIQREKALVRSILLSACVFFGIAGCSQKRVDHHYQAGHTSKARQKFTMRTYSVKGKHYRPYHVKLGETMTGISSWYGPNFHGRQTSSGEIYNMYARTAAHKTWPMDTMVRVTNLDNGRQTVVRINDRGPFVKGRVIDCSYAAGKDLGLDKCGIARVKLEVVGIGAKRYPDTKIVQAKRRERHQRAHSSDFGLQVGAFRQLEGARKCQARYASLYPKYTTVIKKLLSRDGMPLYRVWLIGFRSQHEIDVFKRHQANRV